jgi:putative oxidoreductase
MARLTSIASGRGVPEFPAFALTILRITTGTALFLHHGWEKRPTQWGVFMAHFPNLFHLGSPLSFLIAFFSDFVCSLLIVLGLGTRWAALFCFANIWVAWEFVHHFAFMGRGPAADHGELIVLYLGALAAIALAGPGRFSIDGALSRG